MPFTVRDFQDLLKLLQRYPEWRAQLWATLAGEELLRLPGEFRVFREEAERRFAELREEVAAARAEADRRFAELAEAQRRHYEEFAAHRQEFLAYRAETDRRLAELAEAQRRHYEEFAAYRAETDRRFAELAEAQRQTEGRVGRLEEAVRELAEAQRRTEETVRWLVETVGRIDRRVEHHARDLGEVKGMLEAQRLRDQASLFFSDLLRHPQPMAPERLAERLQEALQAGRITQVEKRDVQAIDLVIEGLHPREDRRLYLAVEVSWQGGTEDVRRAHRRAERLARALEGETWPVVGARELTAAARRMARALGVWWVQDGQAFRPEEIPEEESLPPEGLA